MTISIDWPDKDFQWTDDLDRYLPVVRGIKAPNPVDHSRLNLVFNTVRSHDIENLNRLAEALKQPMRIWDEETTRQNTNADSLESFSHEQWLELLANCLTRHGHTKPYTNFTVTPLAWAQHACAAHRGLIFTVELMQKIILTIDNNYTHYLVHREEYKLLEPIRELIALCDESTHEEVLAYFEHSDTNTILGGISAFFKKQTESDTTMRRIRAQCCPHRSDWAIEIAKDKTQFTYKQNLGSCVVPPTIMTSIIETTHDTKIENLYLQIRLHGNDAIEPLAAALHIVGPYPDNILNLIEKIQSQRSIEILSKTFNHKVARKHLRKKAKEHPAAVLKYMIESVVITPTDMKTIWTKRLAADYPDALNATLSEIDEKTALQFTSLLPDIVTSETTADSDALPQVLQAPPWLNKKTTRKTKPIELNTIKDHEEILFENDHLQSALAYTPRVQSQGAFEQLIKSLGLSPAAADKVMQGQILQSDELPQQYLRAYDLELLLILPDNAAIALTNSIGGLRDGSSSYSNTTDIWHALLAKHGNVVLPGFYDFVQTNIESGLSAAMPVRSATIATVALHAMHKLVKSKPIAKNWLTAHPRSAMTAAIPAALGKAGVQRDAARRGIRWLNAMGFNDVAEAVALEYGPEAHQALAELQKDSLMDFPARIPKLPEFFVASTMTRPALSNSGESLPLAAIDHIGTMLMISSVDTSYAGIAQVKNACTEDSLASLAWDIYNAWLSVDSPAKDAWALHALGHLGNDNTVEELALLIRKWPTQSLQKRSLTGIDVLALIGSEKAFYELNQIIAKVKRKALRERAQQRLAEVSAKLGLSSEQLADRLVPTFGLTPEGTLNLNFGPRQFNVGFDETLKPYVSDDTGRQLKNLPKPRQSDDLQQAEESARNFRKLKKEVKAVASVQIQRLEQNMCSRRRWSLPDCQAYIFTHPIMRQLATRLIWGVYTSEDILIQSFRVAEDLSYASAEDEEIELSDSSTIGIAHTLELSDNDKALFGDLFADYEIMQPFAQLGREIFTLEPTEQTKNTLKIFADKPVASGSIFGLSSRGWDRGNSEDGGYVYYYSKRVEEKFIVNLSVTPGMPPGAPDTEPKRIPDVTLSHVNTSQQITPSPFEILHPVTISEILRDIHQLAPAT